MVILDTSSICKCVYWLKHEHNNSFKFFNKLLENTKDIFAKRDLGLNIVVKTSSQTSQLVQNIK